MLKNKMADLTRKIVTNALKLAFLGIVFGPQVAFSESPAPQGFAVIELFTSQGCSSCPSADENLKRIDRIAQQKGLSVYTLSMHVDYWNFLGWKDPFSSASTTARQQAYARQFGEEKVYTPQMVVNGKVGFVGSDVAKANAAIGSAIDQPPGTALDLTATKTDSEVRIDVSVDTSTPGEIVVCLVQKHASREVSAGENARRTLSHVNVVRRLGKFAPTETNKRHQIVWEVPRDFRAKDFHITAFYQSQEGHIVAANQSKIRENQ